jgi:GPN-loop GTPase
VNITEIITLEDVMQEYGLGPNGAMIYVMEHLEENMDWLVGRLDEVLRPGLGEGHTGETLEETEGAAYVIFDTPGQVELWTNHDSLKNVVVGLTKMDYRVSLLNRGNR